MLTELEASDVIDGYNLNRHWYVDRVVMCLCCSHICKASDIIRDVGVIEITLNCPDCWAEITHVTFDFWEPS